MSRSGYSDDLGSEWAMIRWRGAVKSAIRGKRGQTFLREMEEALDALQVKQLISGDLENLQGVCALGAVGRRRGVDQTLVDPEDSDSVAGLFKIPNALAQEIQFMNDEYHHCPTPEDRYKVMKMWIEENIRRG